jgi:isopentenyl phosphate kinase
MKKIILIKFGGSLITNKIKTNEARLDVIENLAKQVKEILKKNDNLSLIIATGAGGFGHPVAKKYEHNLKKGLPIIKEAVKKINQILVSSLTKAGINAASVEPSEVSEHKGGKMIKLFYGQIISLLERDIIPVFHADLVVDQTRGISILSMDRFLVEVAIELKNKGFEINKVIFCGTTNGVLDNKGKTINKINRVNIGEFDDLFYDNKTVDTTGGMKKKVEECLRLTDEKIPSFIINGQKENNLLKMILGKEVLKTKF